MRRGRGKCRYCLTQGGGRISKVCRDLMNSIVFLSYVNINSRVVAYGAAVSPVSTFEGRSPGNTWQKREVSVNPYALWRYDFKSLQRTNQFDQLSELGQHEMWRRGVRGIWNRDLTCDHPPKAVVQGIRRAKGKYRYCLTQGGNGISKCAET